MPINRGLIVIIAKIDDIMTLEKISFAQLDEDERQAVVRGREESCQGEVFSHEDIDWDNLDEMNLD